MKQNPPLCHVVVGLESRKTISYNMFGYQHPVVLHRLNGTFSWVLETERLVTRDNLNRFRIGLPVKPLTKWLIINRFQGVFTHKCINCLYFPFGGGVLSSTHALVPPIA